MERILALYDQDQGYIARFARYMQNRRQFPFAVYTFTDVEALKQFSNRREIEILLTADAGKESGISLVQAKDVVHLAEEGSVGREGGRCIYKYQSGDAIVRELLQFYGDTRDYTPLSGGREAETLMVFSPIGCCGKSMLALSLAKLLAQEKRVLYLSFEETSWLAEIIGASHRGTLTEALYYFKEGCLDALKLKALVYSAGTLDYIPPVRNPADLTALDAGELERFLSEVRGMGNYDILVVDTDSIISRFFDLFQQCSRVLMPVPADRSCGEKLEKFNRYIETNGGDELKRKMILLSNPNVPLEGERRDIQWLTRGALGDYARQVIRTYIYDEGDT